MAEEQKAVAKQTVSPEQREVTYTAADGSEIRISPDMVRKYLVQGKGEMVTIQEMIYFLNLCRSRKLNPFIKDCYLIKYSPNDPAAVVTSVEYFRKRARAMPDCKGWKAGVIVLDKEGRVKDTAGLVRDGEEILGGWFEAKPSGWEEPMRVEVNLRGYVKKKQDGSITKFWSVENQPSQIAKVAESQGLRKVWPDEFQGLYTEEEISPEDRQAAIDVGGSGGPRTISIPAEEIMSIAQEFDEKTKGMAKMPEYIAAAVNHFKKTPEEIKAEAMKNFQAFVVTFTKWATKGSKKAATDKKAPEKGKDPGGPAPSPEGKPAEEKKPDDLTAVEMAPDECPNAPGTTFKRAYCETCKEFVSQVCPVYFVS